MYYISLYFDRDTEERIQSYMNQIAKKSGNDYMIEGKVPPHITLTAFETKKENEAIDAVASIASSIMASEVFFSSVGMFLPHTIYISPVLNKELFGGNLWATNRLSEIEDCIQSKYYLPFQWLPHVTLGKTLSQEGMRAAFEVIQHQFGPFAGKVTRIGLAKTKPYRDIVVFDLPEE